MLVICSHSLSSHCLSVQTPQFLCLQSSDGTGGWFQLSKENRSTPPGKNYKRLLENTEFVPFFPTQGKLECASLHQSDREENKKWSKLRLKLHSAVLRLFSWNNHWVSTQPRSVYKSKEDLTVVSLNRFQLKIAQRCSMSTEWNLKSTFPNSISDTFPPIISVFLLQTRTYSSWPPVNCAG